MKSIISVLLMFVALSSCQNTRSYQDYAQTARAIPYAPPQSRAQNQYVPPATTTTTTPEPLRTAPPTRQHYSAPAQRSYSQAQYGQQMRAAAITPTPETIRISFSGIEANADQSRMEVPSTFRRSQYGQEGRTTGTGAAEEEGAQVSRSAPRQPIIPILRFDQEIQEGVRNRVHFTAANGIEEEEETLIEHLPPGQRSHVDNEYPASNNYGYGYDSYDNYNYDDVEIVKRGKYSYYSPEGEHIEVSWIADKDGFRPVGSHIPTAAPAIRESSSLPVRQEIRGEAPMARQYAQQ